MIFTPQSTSFIEVIYETKSIKGSIWPKLALKFYLRKSITYINIETC